MGLGIQLDERITLCRQCGRCTAGCPVARFTHPGPHGLIRLLHLGRLEEAVECELIWLCTGCAICRTRCPHEIPIDEICHGLRRDPAPPAVGSLAAVHRRLRRQVRCRGRVWEPGLALARMRHRWPSKAELRAAWDLVRQRRLEPWPSRISSAARHRLDRGDA